MPVKLEIKPVQADLRRDVATFGTMDPYCQINHGSKSMKTGAHDDGGKQPQWGEKFEIETDDPSDVIHFFVMDKGCTSDTIIGACRIKFSDLVKEGGLKQWFSLIFEDKLVGEVEIETSVVEGELEPEEETEEEEKPAKSEEEALANAPPGFVPPPIAVGNPVPQQYTEPMSISMAPTMVRGPPPVFAGYPTMQMPMMGGMGGMPMGGMGGMPMGGMGQPMMGGMGAPMMGGMQQPMMGGMGGMPMGGMMSSSTTTTMSSTTTTSYSSSTTTSTMSQGYQQPTMYPPGQYAQQYPQQFQQQAPPQMYY